MAEGEERRRKILDARGDRLARIMSLGAGRAVDAAEVRLEPLREAPPPSPTESERAAAGLASVLAARGTSDSDSGSGGDSSDGDSADDSAEEQRRSLLDPAPDAPPPCPRRTARLHVMVVALAAALVVVWLRLVQPGDARARGRGMSAVRARVSAGQSTSEPWHVAAGAFLAVEGAEWLLGRISPLSLPRDAALYVFLLLLAVRLGLVPASL